MSQWTDLASWLYGDVRTDRGFWYSHPVYEVRGLDDDHLFWVPDGNALCMLWHVGHIAHRERVHIAKLIQGQEKRVIPDCYEVFGTEWLSVADLKQAVDSPANVLDWVEAVRGESTQFISSLTNEDFHREAAAGDGLSIGHWLFITVAHGALHIGKIQVLRNILEGKRDNPC
jgi:hypothetical protein